MAVTVQAAPFVPGEVLDAFTARAAGAGAIVSFSGVVRGDDGLKAMEIEHYPGMTEGAIAAMEAEARRRFALTDAEVIHRHGPMRTGEVIMMVATAAPHRADAFAAAEFLMDYLKSRAPFWKKERRDSGDAWVPARADDEGALARWQPPGGA